MEAIALANLADDGVLGVLVRLLVADRLMETRVKERPDRFDRRDTLRGEQLVELLERELDALQPGLVKVGGRRFDHPMEVVDHREELADQVRVSKLDGLGMFLPASLFVVVEI